MLSPSEVENLVLRARKGENECFSTLVRAHYRAAYCSALAVVRAPDDARDVVQDALVSAFTELESCREPAKFSGWLLTIVRHRALMALRRLDTARRAHKQATAEDAPQPASPDFLLRARLLKAAEVLSDRQAEVLFLHDLEGWTHPEIAQVLEISEVLSRQVLFEARKKMRSQLEEVSHE